MMTEVTTKPTIIWDETQTPVSTYFDDVYFNTDGAVAETTYVFIEGNQLNERFLQHSTDTFVVAETGFGSGLNFLLLWQTFLQFKKQHSHHQLKKLEFYSVEKYPLSKQEMCDIHAQIIDHEDLTSLAKQLQTSWQAENCYFDDVNLTILFDDVSQFPLFLSDKHCKIDAWFFDGFSPQKNPDMWSESLFKQCYQLTNPQGTFATFSAAGFVRRNLINAGFSVNKRKGYGVKREMLVGSKM